MSRKRVLTLEEISFLRQFYQEKGNSLASCCKELKIHPSTLKRELARVGIPVRNREEAVKASPRVAQANKDKRKYSVKDNFFSSSSSEMAYVLGFIAADGTVSKDTNKITVILSAVDMELLHVLHSLIGGVPPKFYENGKGYESCYWSVSSKEIKQDLMSYGIIPNKTYCKETFTFRELPEEYQIDFIRGYFDGDGSVYYDRAVRTNFTSHTKKILEDIVDVLYEKGVPRVNIFQATGGNFSIRYSGAASQKIYDLFYAKDCLCLKRKKDKFDSLIKK